MRKLLLLLTIFIITSCQIEDTTEVSYSNKIEDTSIKDNVNSSKAAVAPFSFSYTALKGLEQEQGVSRRDPSDVISWQGVYYVYYTKVLSSDMLYPTGYAGTIWVASSTDGVTWKELNQVIGKGQSKEFDGFGVFTPNVVLMNDSFILYYTAVANGFNNRDESNINRTTFGVATSNEPYGTFYKSPNNPILEPSKDASKFDSFRIDDANIEVINDKIHLYYKGRKLGDGPGATKMGLAFSGSAVGPFTRYNNGNPIQASGHEVAVWKTITGYNSLSTTVSPLGIYTSLDGFHFDLTYTGLSNLPKAAGYYKPELTGLDISSTGNRWGVSMHSYGGGDLYLNKFIMTANK